MEPRRITPGEKIPDLGGATVGDFWAWAYSDVLENTVRGIFAEFPVGSALGIMEGVRPSGWGAFDLRYGGQTIEVKSAAYLQSWHQTAPSVIRFGLAEREGWEPETNTWRTERMRPADCYVLCLYAEKDRSRVNVLDASMWQFYVVSTEQINREMGAQKSAGLSTIEAMSKPVGYARLKERVEEVLSGADPYSSSGTGVSRGVRVPGSMGAQAPADGETSIQEFHDTHYQEAQDDYLRWLLHNPQGFVMNLKTNRWAVLHESGCMHIADYSDPNVSLTLKRKVCASFEEPLRVWAQTRGVEWTRCRTCLK
jgi:hypothetical protein